MKAIEIHGAFGPENLKPVEKPAPAAPGPWHVVVRVRAASLNYRDWMVVNGVYAPDQRPGIVPLSDGAGEVVAVGSEVTRVKVGDRVAGIFTQAWLSGELEAWMWARSTLGNPLPGMLQEYNVLDEDGLVHIPPHLSYEEAATLPCAAVTAWNALVTTGRIKAGDTVLLQGTGGVSVFALQFAKLHGARAIITSSSDAKLRRARELGADETVNYKTNPDWDAAARDLTGGRGVDHVVEVGGSGTLQRSLSAVRVGGRVYVIGLLTGITEGVEPLPILRKAINVHGILVGSREMFEQMNRAIAAAKLRPVVDRVFPMAEARAAIETLKGGSHFGKIVIRVD